MIAITTSVGRFCIAGGQITKVAATSASTAGRPVMTGLVGGIHRRPRSSWVRYSAAGSGSARLLATSAAIPGDLSIARRKT